MNNNNNNNIDFTISTITQAVQVLFHARTTTSPQQLQQADDYLKAFGKSPQAWTVSIQILSQEDACQDRILLFQMSRFLKMKWQYDFDTLQSQQQITQLQQQSYKIVQRHASSPDRPLRVQIALLFIYIYMQTFELWAGNDLLSVLLNDMHWQTQTFGFDILENWPEEMGSSTSLVIDQHKLHQFVELVKSNSMNRVFAHLSLLWTTADNSTKYHILQCYTKWLYFVKSTNLTQQYLQTCNACPVFEGALQLIQDEELQERAMNLILRVVALIPKDITPRLLINEGNQYLNQILQRILDATFQSFAQCRISIQDELSDEIHQCVKFYAQIAKRFIHQILLIPKLTQTFLEISLLLFQSEQTDEQSTEMMILWSALFNGLHKYQIEQPNLFKQWQQSQGAFLTLFMDACVKKCTVSAEYLVHYGDHTIKTKELKQSEGDEEIDSLSEEYEIKKECRSKVQQILECMCVAIEPKSILIQLAAFIKTVMHIFQNQDGEFRSLPQNIQQNCAQFEACIFLTNSIIPSILEGSDAEAKVYVIEIMSIYLRMNKQQTNSFVVKTTLQTITKGGATLLLDQRDLVQRVFDYVYFYLQYPHQAIQKQATFAFVKICQSNHEFVLRNIDIFLKMLKSMENIDLIDDLIGGLAEAVGSEMESIKQYFVPLCSVFANNLASLKADIGTILLKNHNHKLTTKQVLDQNKSIFKNVSKNLDALTVTLSKLPQEDDESFTPVHQLVVCVYKELWPILDFLVEHASKYDKNIAEKVVRLTKHTWRCTFQSFDVQFLTQVLTKFIECYKNNPQSSFIYSTEIIATVFYKYPEYHQVLSEAFEMMCDLSFKHLPDLSAFEANPDLTEDFFGMLQRYARYSPELLLPSKSFDQILKMSEVCIGIQHQNAAKSLYGWLETLCKFLSRNKEPIFRTHIPQHLIDDLKQRTLHIMPIFLQDLFLLVKAGISDPQIQEYIFDVIGAILNIDSIDFLQVSQDILSAFDSISRAEKDNWYYLMSNRTFDSEQLLNLKSYLLKLNQRSIQLAMRNDG